MNYKEMKTKNIAVDLAKKYNKEFNVLDFNEYEIDNVQNLLISLETTEEFFMQQYLYKSQSDKGIKVSAVRARQTLNEIKSLIPTRRQEIQEQKMDL